VRLEATSRRRLARHALAAAAVLVVSLPLSLILTMLLMPLWSWLEASYGIESVGHSGPSEWCYGLVFVACVCAGGAAYAVRASRRDERTVTVR
jgi:hypothetical protein